MLMLVKDENNSVNMLNNDLRRISKRAYNRKKIFHPDPSKPAKR